MFRTSGQNRKNYRRGGLRTASFSFLFAALTLGLCAVSPMPLKAQGAGAEPEPPAAPEAPAEKNPAAPAAPPADGEVKPAEPAAPLSAPEEKPAIGPEIEPLSPPEPSQVPSETAPPLQPQSQPPVPAAVPEVEDKPGAEPAPSPPPMPAPNKTADSAANPDPPAEAQAESAPESSSDLPDLDPDHIRFTAWNLKNYLHVAAPPPPGSSEKSKSPREMAAVVALLRRLHPDILGVCEMGSAADLAVLQADLKKAGLDLPQAEWVEGADPSRHLALLTRFPIVSRQPVTDLRYVLDDSQFPVQRGFLDVTLRVNSDYALRLVGTHLKSRLDVPEADQELMRRNEAHLLRQHIDSVLVAEPEANLLVYGDFNDSRDQPSVKAIKGMRGAAAALSEIPAEDDSGERWTFYYPTADEYSRIDFLLASSGLMPEVRKGQAFLPGGSDWSRASDHRPLTLDLTADDAATPRARSRSRSKTKPKTAVAP